MTREPYNAAQHDLNSNQAENAGDCSSSAARVRLPRERFGHFVAMTLLAGFVVNEIWEMAQMAAYVETA